jgi:DNA-binding transcriptional MerR regulator
MTAVAPMPTMSDMADGGGRKHRDSLILTLERDEGIIEVEVNFKSSGFHGHFGSRQEVGRGRLGAAVLRTQGPHPPVGVGRRRRQFAPAVLDQLALIALGQAAGFSLDEIRVMLTPGGEPNIDRAMLASKADELERMVKRLKAMIEGCGTRPPAPRQPCGSCPSFQRLLKAAAAGALESRWTWPSSVAALPA